MKTRELTCMAFLGALLYVSQAALSFLPNIELVSTLVLTYTLVLGRRALFPVYVFVLLEGVTYGFGLWWFMYLYVWAVLYLAVRLLRRNTGALVWAAVSGFYGLSFGALCTIPYLLAGGPGAAFAYWTSGLSFDLLHCAGNFAATLVLYRPFMTALQYVKRQAGL